MRKVLLIDDDGQHWAEVLNRPFNADNWHIVVAKTAESGIYRLQQRDIGVILLDLQFAHSQMQGTDALTVLKSNYPDIPVIIITSSGKATDIRTAIECVKNGAWDYFTKSKLDANRLLQECNKAVESALTHERLNRLVDSFHRTVSDSPFILSTTEDDGSSLAIFAIKIIYVTQFDKENQDILSYQRWFEDQMHWHENLVSGLLSRLPGRTVELRYINTVTEDGDDSLGIFVVGRIKASNLDIARQGAHELWIDLQSLLHVNDKLIGFTSVSNENDLRIILKPFHVKEITEFRREGVSVPVEDDITHIGFGEKTDIVKSKDILIPRPLPQTDSLMKVFCETLSHNKYPVLVSIKLDCDSVVLPDIKNGFIPQDLLLSQDQSGVLWRKFESLYNCETTICNLRICVASEKKLPSSLLNMIGTELISTEPSLWKTYNLSTKNVEKAVTDYAIKLDNIEVMETLTTVYTISEATHAFRLPIVIGAGYIGLSTNKPQYTYIPKRLPKKGALLGVKHTSKGDINIRIPDEDRTKHVYVLGQTGTGKSTLMTSMILSDIEAGKGVCVLDPHGDLIDYLLPRIPEKRADDLIHLDPGCNVDTPFGLNLFEARTDYEKDFVVQESINIFYKLFDPNRTGMVGPQFEHWMRNGALTLMSSPEGGTLIDISVLFTDLFEFRKKGGEGGEFMKAKRSFVTNPAVKDFWRQIDGATDFHISEMMNYFISKFSRFSGNRTIRNIMGQTKSTINLRDAMDTSKILLINLSKGMLGDMNSNLLGSIFLSRIYMAAMSRQELAINDRRPFYIYLDEFQNFATESMESMLSEIRKYGVALVLAHQNQAQLPTRLLEAVLGNVNSTIFFRPGAPDANRVNLYLQNRFTEAELVNFPNWHVIARILIDNVPSIPFVFNTVINDLQPNNEIASYYREMSKRKYGRPSEIVEREINKRLMIDR